MRLPLYLTLAITLLVGGVMLYVTDFTAYLGSDPTTCNNCHVMDAAYEGWFHGGHRQWATCNDCHTPHDFIPKYLVKAENGFRHVSAFLTNEIPNAIRAKEFSRDVIQENCVRCHTATIANLDMDPDRYCFECHRSVAHGERGVSILPYQDTTPYREDK